jgi:DNA replication protein DnaC
VDSRQSKILPVAIPPPIKAEVDRQLEEALEASRQRVSGMIEKRRAAGENFDEIPETPENRRERLWLAMCPDDFHDTERRRLPCSAAVIQRVLAHPIRIRSLRLSGPTGSGKTRLAWELLHPEFNNGAKITAFDAGEFGAKASGAYRDGIEEEFFASLMKPDILFLDDIGKGRLTARVVEALFTIIDRRGNARKAILATMNYTIEALRTKMLTEQIDPETTEALLRRIQDRFEVIPVTKAN